MLDRLRSALPLVLGAEPGLSSSELAAGCEPTVDADVGDPGVALRLFSGCL